MHDRFLSTKEKKAMKEMRSKNRALEIHLEINGGPKNPGHAILLAAVNSERIKNGLKRVDHPPGHNAGGSGRKGRGKPQNPGNGGSGNG